MPVERRVAVDSTGMGNRLCARRRALGLTQVALARTLGVTASFISGIEKGERLPSLEMLARLCGALDLSMDALALGKSACAGSCPLIRDIRMALERVEEKAQRG